MTSYIDNFYNKLGSFVEGFDSVCTGDFSPVARLAKNTVFSAAGLAVWTASSAAAKLQQVRTQAADTFAVRFFTRGTASEEPSRILTKMAKGSIGMLAGYVTGELILAPSETDDEMTAQIKTYCMGIAMAVAVGLHMQTICRQSPRLITPRTVAEGIAGTGLIACTMANPGFFLSYVSPIVGRYAVERYDDPNAVLMGSTNLWKAQLPREAALSVFIEHVTSPWTVWRGAAKTVRFIYPYAASNSTNLVDLAYNPMAHIKQKAEAFAVQQFPRLKPLIPHLVHVGIKGFDPYLSLLYCDEVRIAHEEFKRNPDAQNEAALSAVIREKLGESIWGYGQTYELCKPHITPILNNQLAANFAKLDRSLGFSLFEGTNQNYAEGIARVFCMTYIPFLLANVSLTQPISRGEEIAFLRRCG